MSCSGLNGRKVLGRGSKEKTTPRKAVSDPPHLGMFFPAPPPSIPFILVSPLESPRVSPSQPPQKQLSEGLQKWFPTGHPREVLFFGTFCPPPLLALPRAGLVLGVGCQIGE